jgi:hypothetical protein
MSGFFPAFSREAKQSRDLRVKRPWCAHPQILFIARRMSGRARLRILHGKNHHAQGVPQK